MTLRDNGKSEIGLNGPNNLSGFIHATRFFLYHERLKFDCVGFTGKVGEKYEDENLTIWPVLLYETHSIRRNWSKSRTYHYSSSSDEDEQPSAKKYKLDPKSTSVCYICQLAPLPGKFFPKKAKELGVPKGPLFGDLYNGKTVTLEDGRQIKPEQVMGPSEPGPVFMIIDCLSNFLPSLMSNKQLQQYWEKGPFMTPVVIVHLIPMRVFQSTEYEEWMKRFGDNVSHVLINKDKPLMFLKLKKMNYLRTAFLERILLKFHLRPIKQQGFDRSDVLQNIDFNSIVEETQTLLAGKLNVLAGATGFEQRRHDTNELASSASSASSARSLSTSSSAGSRDLIRNPPRDPFSKFRNPFRDIADAVGLPSLHSEERGCTLQEIIQIKAQHFTQNKHKDAHYEVVFLGTGASIPSKYRNVSSTLINMSGHMHGENGSILLDCGEGTYGQLYRHYGKYVDRVLLQLKCVFISHIHADHHLGLIRILRKRDTMIGKWLQEYDTICEDIDYWFVDSSEFVAPRGSDHLDVNSLLEAKEVITVPVDHCPEAYGFVLEHRRGWKIVYSGDTRPCPALIKAGKEADLLIHEATLEDELKAEALAKKHSTTTEAIESGVKMDAKFIMLNHFSQRYPKIPVFNEKFTKHTGIAFDHMKIHSSNFSKIPQLLEPLKLCLRRKLTK
ncbi:Zinc phosphodiesterase ELAC protein 2 [Desmophyllum pertusum]|uniref:Zinc phosphodiesterase ELAC protein 2 n=1 Tax=Desmophyllum pertusum TaxID=174260 RepID=A0A9W9Z086_9CNID|nr:Zinc phosphodiesterase ELAC protein 2 [Desmophyllum pertusum]